MAGAGNYGTLTCNGGVVFNGGTNLVDISNTTNDLLVVNSGLYLSGGGKVVLNISGSLNTGIYPVISYDSINSGSISSLGLIPTTVGSKSLSLILTNNNGIQQIAVVVTATGNQSLVWASAAQGAPNNNWDVETDANWTNSALHALDIFDNGGTRIFQ